MRTVCCLAVCMMMAVAVCAQEYEEVERTQVEVSPKDYRGKKVAYTGTFLNFSSTIPTYMQWNNIKPNRYIIVSVGSNKLPVVFKNTDENTKRVAELKKGRKVKVSGRVKEFSVKPTRAMLPYYYVEADTIEPQAEEAGGEAGEKPKLPPGARRRIRRRLEK